MAQYRGLSVLLTDIHKIQLYFSPMSFLVDNNRDWSLILNCLNSPCATNVKVKATLVMWQQCTMKVWGFISNLLLKHTLNKIWNIMVFYKWEVPYTGHCMCTAMSHMLVWVRFYRILTTTTTTTTTTIIIIINVCVCVCVCVCFVNMYTVLWLRFF